jgi:hypothetical protein
MKAIHLTIAIDQLLRMNQVNDEYHWRWKLRKSSMDIEYW